jgi:hypothetical protein
VGFIVKEVHGTGKSLEYNKLLFNELVQNGCGAGGGSWLRGPQSIPKAQSE